MVPFKLTNFKNSVFILSDPAEVHGWLQKQQVHSDKIYSKDGLSLPGHFDIFSKLKMVRTMNQHQ
jgi:hypothetical protein